MHKQFVQIDIVAVDVARSSKHYNDVHTLYVLAKQPWVHGLNKSRVPSHNGGTIYRVAI